ncbi:DUF4157 domain-containing protein [Actinophytocola oryzae]|uniref:eCIS core domain-containing protein n=1 Tax=Actinophytocola oryzae TaxID=502181 RepID=UPI001FB93AA6|nr:DUF4157 domain-containing protein [Actinophytocola oryzae]
MSERTHDDLPLARARPRATAEAVSSRAPAVAPGVDFSLASVTGVINSPGTPLDPALRTDMENRFGADFSGVRVHTDTAARRSARAAGALAYTAGEHIVLGGATADRATLTHELTHVVQQRAGTVDGVDAGGGLRVSTPTDRFEREAESSASGQPAGPARSTGPAQATGVTVQRRSIGGSLERSVVSKAETAEELHLVLARVWALTSEDDQKYAIRQAITRRRYVDRRWNGALSVDELHDLLTRYFAGHAPNFGAAQAEKQDFERILTELRWNVVDAAFDVALVLDESFGGAYYAEQILRQHYASCYPTAENLFPVLTDGQQKAELGSFTFEPEDVVADMAGQAGRFREVVGGLTRSIYVANSKGVETVFRVEFAGHGFLLVLRRDDPGGPMGIELLESLAHSASLDVSFRRPPREVKAVIRDLLDMADDDARIRSAAAGRFGWNADALFLHESGRYTQAEDPLGVRRQRDPGGFESESFPIRPPGSTNPHATPGEYFPLLRMNWWARPLFRDQDTNETGVDRWMAVGRNRYDQLKGMLNPP